jgi:hypothetical protein
MKTKNVVNLVHWTSLGSAAVVSAATVFSGDPKFGSVALALISISQVVHKFADALENKDTLEQAVAKTAASIKL